MGYHHFILSERELLAQYKAMKLSHGEIASRFGKHKSSIGRELKRNHPELLPSEYFCVYAHRKAQSKRDNPKARFASVSLEIIDLIKKRLSLFESPKQLIGGLKLEGYKMPSHETIYQMIYANHHGMGEYAEFLRRGRKKRRKRGIKGKKKQIIPNRRPIEERPNIKGEFGYWEGDTVVGKDHQSEVLTLVETFSKSYIAIKLNETSKKGVVEAIKEVRARIGAEVFKTITWDNSPIFASHQEVSEIMGCDCYFANPYRSWERPLNEHCNGLLRQLFPKGTDFRSVTQAEIDFAVGLINNRPREVLDYKRPFEVFLSQPDIKCNKSDLIPVALQT